MHVIGSVRDRDIEIDSETERDRESESERDREREREIFVTYDLIHHVFLVAAVVKTPPPI